MGWIPSRDYHGGIAEIIEERKVPTMWAITDSEYLEGPDIHVTGYMDKKKQLRELGINEAGDRVGGARMESPKGKSLHFDMGDSSVPTD
jgi:hypothetical protein